MRILLLVLLLSVLSCRPTNYDLRVQPSITRYADYSLKFQGMCVSYAWAKELAQIASNAFSLAFQNRVSLSAQQLLDCSKFESPPCHQVTMQHIQSGLTYLEKQGLTLDFCYVNTPLTENEGKCKRKCADGFDFPQIVRAKTIKHSTVDSLLTRFENSQTTVGFLVVKMFDSMNYYSSEKPGYLKADGQFFELRVAEVVGWKNKGKEVIVRFGPGEGWGYSGYANLDVASNDLIEGVYELAIVDNNSGRMPTFIRE